MKITSLNILLIIAATIFCKAQSNQIIIQLNDGITPYQLNASQNMHRFVPSKQISKHLNIWLIEIHANQKREMVLQTLLAHPQVKTAQFNAPVELRNTPNDPLFDEQWQYNNKAIYQGITDADIDALKAWDITTGGKTAFNDEIVVAVIDGGVDLNHPDLINNLWTNSNEIPGNYIDDDRNGYIDDFYGWNFNDGTADVGNYGYGHWHGTPVTGIIGAEGNNNQGVCGVNWNVKVMNLAANQNVIDVIAAYDYILEMRKRYNDSRGMEGAFIVATNTSLGINGGQPADHPLWCAMYDALGEAGILSVGATANQSIDVDERGDLPTTCTSNYLISVTNTNNRDELDFAAYGKQHIDLSAPGSGVFTVSNNGEYGVFGGTSAAAPHVAGAVALLYSLSEPGLMKIAQQNPSTSALLIKDFILQGTDPLADLYQRTVSNGRLNLFNSVCEMQNYFDNNSCVEAQEVSIQINDLQLNPIAKEAYIQFEMQGESSVKVRLFDAKGSLLRTQELTNINTGKHQLTFGVENLKTGVYYAFINTKNTALGKVILVP